MGLSHRYCCVAVPLYNVGVFAILTEQFVAGMVIGILNFSSPDIVAVDIPSFCPIILGVACILTALLQGWGFWSVFKEKPANFRLFARVNFGAVLLCHVLALIWIIISAAKHSTVTMDCVRQFTSDNSSLDGQSICDIFCWVQLGVMGLLWLIFALSQSYFCFVLRVYGVEQRSDHAKYNSIYSAAGEDIGRNSVWDARASKDELSTPKPFLGHGQSESQSSLRNEVPADPYSDYYEKGGYPQAQQQHQQQQQPYGYSSADAYAAQQQQQYYGDNLMDTSNDPYTVTGYYPPAGGQQQQQPSHGIPYGGR